MADIRAQRTLNIRDVPVRRARQYAEQRFRKFGKNLRRLLPIFNNNYVLTQNLLSGRTLKTHTG